MDEMALLVHKVHLVEMEGMDWLVLGVSQARIWGFLGRVENQDRLVHLACVVPLGKQDPLGPAGEAWFTPGGVLAPVLV